MAVAASNQNDVALEVTVTQGQGNLPKLLLISDHGSEVEIYLFGVALHLGKTWCFNGERLQRKSAKKKKKKSKDMVFQWQRIRLTCHISSPVKTLIETVNQ
ncbi:hypothetical protein J1N35_010070 [Gossypium stocksii]|uniref:Uncharacterized protein n=1 Tax=Gossypium stocksii TaxID=47602 RepID=A0A9D4AA66_9ROSI|nr:hypothetical protein J1N35_010070 [Gossypium stocksii]